MNRFYELSAKIRNAYQTEEYDETKILAFEYLNAASQNKGDWNYGNAIHVANIFLGLVALRESEIVKAKDCLIEAGNSPGSPQLNSFGPNMTLAKELLEIGEKDIVLRYLDLCKNFWKWYLRRPMAKWRKEINRGNIPEFGANLIYHTFNSDELNGHK